MKRKWLFIPDVNRLEESCALAEEFGAAFEYDDFFMPAVYTNPEEVERRITAYLGCGRDTSRDTLHGVFFDVKPTSLDPVMAQRGRALMRQSMEIADRLGVRGVVFHTDIYGGMRLTTPAHVWVDAAEPLFRELCASFPRLEIYLENTIELDPTQLVMLAERMREVPNFKLCLDYAHAMLGPTPPEVWVRSLAPFIGHMHLNDHDGITDLHEACGTQGIDFGRFAALADAYLPGIPVLMEVSTLEKARASMEYMNAVQPRPDAVLAEGLDAPPTTAADSAQVGSYSVPQLFEVLETNLALSREKNKTALLDIILSKSMQLSRCDAGTLYVLRDGALHFKIMKTISQGIDRGGDGEEIDLPPVALASGNVCGWAVLNAATANVADVYADDTAFDFSGPRKYDAMTGYHTQSVLAVPLIDDEGQALGVMQLINAQDEAGAICAFSPQQVRLIQVQAAQAAITLRQMSYIEEIHGQMWSFTRAMATAIDQRTPYNGSHTRKVAEYAELIACKLNEACADPGSGDYFDEERLDQLAMAAWLHDIGKMVIPTAVMDKPTRLGANEERVRTRIRRMRDANRIAYLEGRIGEAEYASANAALDEAQSLVDEVNAAGFCPPEQAERIRAVGKTAFVLDGSPCNVFADEEIEQLCVMKGTLTERERAVMQSHVAMTERILKEVRFNDAFAQAPLFAAQHHELLDGSGYPRGLGADDLPLETRILTVADICDALLADDRPYKRALPRERAFGILCDMASEGKLERRLVDLLKEAIEEADAQQMCDDGSGISGGQALQEPREPREKEERL